MVFRIVFRVVKYCRDLRYLLFFLIIVFLEIICIINELGFMGIAFNIFLDSYEMMFLYFFGVWFF